MGIENVGVLALNRGLISALALARADIKRVAWAAEEMTNYMPRVLGSMMLRPGFQYRTSTRNNAFSKYLPFIYAITDTALIECSNLFLRVLISDTAITRVAVSTAVTNGDFTTDLTGWSDNDEAGATSSWAAGALSLVGTHFSAAIRRQTLAVVSADQNVEHAFRIVIDRGPVTLRVGSTSTGDEYIRETMLGTGTHSLAFTPTGSNVFIQLSSLTQYAVLVASINIEAAGVMELPTPWLEASLSKLRYDQSGDVIFVACDTYQQRKIERRATRSWSIVTYEPLDGPFRVQNVTTTTLIPSAISGDITLTASRAIFLSTHVGALFRLTSIGQRVELSITAENQFTTEIRVTGVGTARLINIEKGGTWVATMTLQRSIGEPGAWSDVSGQTFTTNGNTTYNDGLDNQVIFYRIGVKTGNFTSGTIAAALAYSSGGLTGIAKIKAVSTSVSATASVLTALGGTDATEDWAEGAWSDYRGWPSAVAFYEGRLWWTGKGSYWGSVSDAYESFDDETEGDSGPISRTIGSGPVDVISWLLPLQRLIAGAGAAEWSARSTSFDEPLTPTNFNLKAASTQGSGNVDAVRIDSTGIFVQRSGQRVFQLAYSYDANDYAPSELTELTPEVCSPGVVRMAVQRQPDTRIHCILSDGTVAVEIFNRGESVVCWVKVETDGDVEDVVVLPGDIEDAVYYVVKRTINGSDVRYLEKWAREDQCRGATDSRCADSFALFTNATPAASVPAGTCSHLVGESVVVWADGKCLADASGGIATFTVDPDGGISALTSRGVSYVATSGCVGLAYRARFKGTKLAYAAELGSAFNQRKKPNRLGIMAADMHNRGITFGQDFDHMDDLPRMESYQLVDEDYVWAAYDQQTIWFPGSWGTDPRLCLESHAPRPATLLGVTIGVETHDISP